MIKHLFERTHLAIVLGAAANAFAGTATSTPVNVSGAAKVGFILHRGPGGTGTGTAVITVEVCDSDGSNPVAVPFRYVAVSAGETRGDLTDADVGGVTWEAGADAAFLVDVETIRASANDAGKEYVRVVSTEGVAGAYDGGILAQLYDLRFTPDEETAVLGT